MKQIKKFLTLIPISLLIIGCGKKDENKDARKTEGKSEIVFWHWWTDRKDIFEDLAKQYKKKTGVTIRFQVAAPMGSDYNNKLQAAAQANTLPDIIGIAAGGEFLARYVNAGKIHELTPSMTRTWKKGFFPRAIQDFSYLSGNQYGVKPNTTWAVPISAMTIQIFYNVDLFKKAGLDPENPPKTWKEFTKAGKKLKKKKIIPLSIGFGDIWMIGAFLEPYAWSYLGQKKMIATLQGDYPYNSPEWRKVLNLFKELKDKKILVEGSVTAPNKESEQLFATGRCAMIMNGSWGVSVFKSMNPNLNYGVMRLPKPDDASHPMYVRGGVGSGAAVTASSKHKEEAVKFIRWLTSKEQQAVYANKGLDLPANRESLPKLLPNLKPFAEGMNDLIPDIGLSEKYEVQETLWKGIQSILIGEKDASQVLKEVDRAKQKVLKKA